MTTVFVLLFGLCLGSFINVVAHRLVKNQDIVKGRSRCDSCKHVLAWYDLIPVVSFVVLLGRCRYCHKGIDMGHFISEIVCALLVWGCWVLAVQTASDDWLVVAYFIIYSGIAVSLWGLVIADFHYYLLPDQLMFSFFLFSLLFKFLPFISDLEFRVSSFGIDILTGLINAVLFILLIIISKGRGMGLGDVKLVFIIGLLLGFPLGFGAIYLAFLTGGLLAAILVLSGKKRFGQIIPFGPFLIGSTYYCLFFGNQLLIWLSRHI